MRGAQGKRHLDSQGRYSLMTYQAVGFEQERRVQQEEPVGLRCNNKRTSWWLNAESERRGVGSGGQRKHVPTIKYIKGHRLMQWRGKIKKEQRFRCGISSRLVGSDSCRNNDIEEVGREDLFW